MELFLQKEIAEKVPGNLDRKSFVVGKKISIEDFLQ